MGVPGRSNAITIAKGLGLNTEIINRSIELNETNHTDLSLMLSKLDDQNTILSEKISFYESENQLLINKINELKENVNIDLYSGCEIYCDSENINTVITELNNKLIPTINNTQYILVEFFPYARADEIVDCVKQLCKHNYKIIIAHVERCLDLFKEEKWIPMLQQLGCYFQINAYSIFDERDLRIKTFAQKLLKEKSVTFLGSDAHRTTHRPYMIQNGLNYVYENCDEEYAKDICYRNAESLLNIK